MMFIDPHTHMISRTTNDYEAMARSGVVALIEPAFWIGQPRTYVGTYIDYLSTIIGWERFRAGQFGIRHYCTVGLNSKEANNEELAEGVMEILPRFALKDGVVAIGEIGYDEQTELEDKYFRLQLELAKELELPVMIHTPHRDKKRGTTRSMDVIEEHGLAVDSLRTALEPLAEELVVPAWPHLLKLANVQHLATRAHARLAPGVSALDAVAALHPTAAVGGTPTETAMRYSGTQQRGRRRRRRRTAQEYRLALPGHLQPGQDRQHHRCRPQPGRAPQPSTYRARPAALVLPRAGQDSPR